MLSVILIAFVGFSLIMAGLYFYLFARSQERFIQYWGLCWVFYSLSLLCLILGHNLEEIRLFEVRKVFDVLNILSILYGVYSFSNRRVPGYWMRFTLYLMIWMIASAYYGFSAMAIYLPLSLFQIAMTVVLCYVVFAYWELKGLKKWLPIIVFFFWGSGKAIASLYEWYFAYTSSLYLVEIIFSNVLNFIIFIVYLERVGERLGFAERIFKMMAENASDIIFIYSLKSNPNFSYVTPSVERILGYSPQDFYNDSRFYLNIVDIVDLERIERFFQPVAGKEDLEEDTGIFSFLNKNSELIWGEINRTIIYEGGRAVAIEGIIRDVTVKKEAEEQLVRAKGAREQLLSYVSHELKTPVTSILGYITAMRDGTIREASEKEKALEIVFNKTLLLENLIQDLFQLSKLETKQFGFDFVLINGWELSEELIQTYGPDIKNAGLKLNLIKNRDDLINANVIADTQRIGQVFNNILQNAIRYSEREDILQIKFLVDKKKELLIFSVSDRGRGISQEEIEYIFDRFYKGKDKGINIRYDNAGIGLTISKEIIEAHGGKITAKSSLGRGSTFSVQLPLYKD